MSLKTLILATAAALSLTACGQTLPEQALGGAAIGAGAAAIASGSLAQGAAIGAAGNVAYCQLYPGRCN